MDKARLEAFSDGVFAIAITLLVLDLHVPEVAPGALADALGRQWPADVSYVVSFVTIGIIWVNHHNLMRHLDHTDRGLLFLNVLFLMTVAVLPYPTALVSHYARTPNATTAALVYGGTMVTMALLFNALWHYAIRGRRLLVAGADPREVSGITRSYLPGPVLYLTGTLVALVDADASLVIYALIAAFYVASSSLWGRRDAA
ncbi:MAG: TMEM175 family protein [Gaiellales bacterium]